MGARSWNPLHLEMCSPEYFLTLQGLCGVSRGILGSVTFEIQPFFFFLNPGRVGLKCWQLMLKYTCRRFVKCKVFFFFFLMVHSFMGACAPGLRAWGCTDVLSRTYSLQQLTLCFHGFLCFVLFFWKWEKSWRDDFYDFFLFCFLLFIASDGAAFLYLSVFTVSHYFFFLMFCALVFDPGPFWSCFILKSSYSVLADSRI